MTLGVIETVCYRRFECPRVFAFLVDFVLEVFALLLVVPEIGTDFEFPLKCCRLRQKTVEVAEVVEARLL